MNRPQVGKGARILMEGNARFVTMPMPGDDGLEMEAVRDARVTIFESGVMLVETSEEIFTTHQLNCEVVWDYVGEVEPRGPKIVPLRPRPA